MTADIHSSLLKRKIIHIDMDCYYAAVEELDFPELKGKPLAIGGKPGTRGVLCTANYEARKYGVRSALPASQAAKLCPHLIFRPTRFERYQELTKIIRAIFYEFTDRVEPLSLDEAYLDVTNNPQNLYAVEIAKRIRQKIFDTTGLTASAGVGPNKMVAKIASDIRKPNGMTVVLPEYVKEFMAPLSLRKIPGIGPVSAKKLAAHNLHICQDIWALSQPALQAKVGENFGAWLSIRAKGIDEREVRNKSVRKSVGRESTYAADLVNYNTKLGELWKLSQSVSTSLKKVPTKGRTITIKIRDRNFKTITRAKSLDCATDCPDQIFEVISQLFEKSEAKEWHTRLLGVSVTKLKQKTSKKDNSPISLLLDS